jgi:hypothetical protein
LGKTNIIYQQGDAISAEDRNKPVNDIEGDAGQDLYAHKGQASAEQGQFEK